MLSSFYTAIVNLIKKTARFYYHFNYLYYRHLVICCIDIILSNKLLLKLNNPRSKGPMTPKQANGHAWQSRVQIQVTESHMV